MEKEEEKEEMELSDSLFEEETKAKSQGKTRKNSKEKKKEEDKEKLKKYITYLILKTVSIVVLVFILCNFVFGIFVCHDNSNFPSVRDGDLCITYKLSNYISGDIVAYEHDDKIYFGKIIGKPGDVIDFNDNGFTLNGNSLMETVYYKTELREDDSHDNYPLTLGENEYYILAEMREEGKDSRNLGTVDGSEMRGKMALLVRRRGFGS